MPCLNCAAPCEGDVCDRACAYALEERARYAKATHACGRCDEPCDCDQGRNDYAVCGMCTSCLDQESEDE